jgi:DNA repair exonuclease SbcCD ATPase subunit
MLSSGEQSLVSFIFKYVLNNLRGKSDFLIIDEGLDRLDEVNRERVLSLLETSRFIQILIISHREDIQQIRAVDKIVVKKELGVSTIVKL